MSLITDKKPSQAQLNLLLGHYQSGQYDTAERLAKSISQEFPNHGFSWKILGAIFKKTGRLDEASLAGQKAVEVDPNDPEVHFNLGNTYKDLGALKESAICYNRAISLKTDFFEAYSNLGITLGKLGRPEDSIICFRQAISIKPGFREACNNLGVALKELGELGEAEETFRRIIGLTPNFARAHNDLGSVLKEQGRLKEAETSCRKAIAIDSNYSNAFFNLGDILLQLGKLGEAELNFKKTIKLNFNYTNAYISLGATLSRLDRFDEAVTNLRQAIAFEPSNISAHLNLGATLQCQGKFEEAKASYIKVIVERPDSSYGYINLSALYKEIGYLEKAEENILRAIELEPAYALSYINLGSILKESGRVAEAAESYELALSLEPDNVEARSNLLMLNGSMLFERKRYMKCALDYSDTVKLKIGDRFSNWSCSDDLERLRIGFVSGDFRSHPVGYFLEGLIRQLQSSSIELYAYPTNGSPDVVSKRLKSLFHSWKPLVGKSDHDCARIIHNDSINILIDLSGHTASNRLPIFCLKPAPIQVTWLGYFASTGLSEIDYILGDPFVTPKKDANHFVEKIWQLPDTYLCFTEPDTDMEVGPLPALLNGFVTFGCFNRLERMTEDVVSVRAKILHATPRSMLFLKSKQFDNQPACDLVKKRFAAHGISDGRLILEGSSTRNDYLSCYNRVDIVLSPFPYGGGTTSAEALWMGVPSVVKKGQYFLSRIGESIANNAGLSDWIADNDDDYIVKALKFSSDLEALSALRSCMREKLLRTSLFDAKRFAGQFEEAVWEMNRSIPHR